MDSLFSIRNLTSNTGEKDATDVGDSGAIRGKICQHFGKNLNVLKTGGARINHIRPYRTGIPFFPWLTRQPPSRKQRNHPKLINYNWNVTETLKQTLECRQTSTGLTASIMKFRSLSKKLDDFIDICELNYRLSRDIVSENNEEIINAKQNSFESEIWKSKEGHASLAHDS